MKLKIKRINPNAILPTYANDGDAGLDLYAIEDACLQPGETKLIPTGLQIQLPKGTEAQVRPRSGLALKYSVTVLNSPGTIDFGYRGEVGVILINHSKEEFHVEKGTRIAQLVVKPILRVQVKEVDILSDTKRGSGGFGSSGK